MKKTIIMSVIITLLVSAWLCFGIFLHVNIIAIPLAIFSFALMGSILFLCVLGIIYTFRNDNNTPGGGMG
jgi:hypothetical protein